MQVTLKNLNAGEVHALSEQFETASLKEILEWTWKTFGTRAAIGTSFQGAGLVMMDHAVKAGFRFPIFTLDTQLLFPETLELKKRLEDFFDVEIESLQPAQTPEQQATEHGAELWARKPDFCCTLRKVIPLQKKLAQLDVWITGVRREQSATRTGSEILEQYVFDPLREQTILKLNPMANWTRDAVWNYLREQKIPYNPLTDRGYRSIGCMPCTRPTSEGENERAGRWTGFEKAECGIHTFLGNKL